MSEVVIEPAIFEDLDELSNLLGELFSEEQDFRPNKQKQLQGLRLIFEEPNGGRVFVLTYSALPTTYKKYEGAFEKLLASFKWEGNERK